MCRQNVLSRSALVLALSMSAWGCEVHDNVVNIPNATVNATVSADVDVNNVAPGATVPVNVTVSDNIYLIEPTATPPAEHINDSGHIQVYLDDVSKPPLVVTASTMINVPIPADTKPGRHKLICRVHKHDKTPTSTKVEVDVNVSVKVGEGDGGTSISVDASTSGTGGTTGTGGTNSGVGGNAGAGGIAGEGGTEG